MGVVPTSTSLSMLAAPIIQIEIIFTFFEIYVAD